MATTHRVDPEDGPLFELDDIPPGDDQAVAAARIRGLMGERRVSQARLAAAVGVSRPGLSDRLAGKTNFTLRELGRVARAFGLSIRDLFPPMILTALALATLHNEDSVPPEVFPEISPMQLSLFGEYDTHQAVSPPVTPVTVNSEDRKAA